MKAFDSKFKILAGVLLALALALSLGYTTLADASVGTLAIQFISEGSLISGGSVELTAPLGLVEDNGTTHTFLHWIVGDEQRDTETISIDVDTVDTVQAVYNTDSTITIKLQDSDGTPLTGGSLRYHDGSWKTATDNGDGTFTVDTEASSVTYEMTFNNGKQTKSNVPVDGTPVIFTTVTTTPALKDSDGNTLAGGTVKYHQIGWQDWTDANTAKELLPGKYTFQMTFNNGKQTKSNYDVPAEASHEVLFTTVTTTPMLKDSDGNSLVGGTVKYHQIGWQDWTDANTAKELLPGKYTFQMTYNNGKQTKSNYDVPAEASHEILFKTTTTVVRLASCADAGHEGGSVRYHQVGWQDFSDTDSSGNVTRELLPGKYTFEMTFNNGRQTLSNHEILDTDAQQVLFETTKMTFGYPGTLRYHQLAWQDFIQPTMHLLPGKYTFKFIEDDLTLSNIAVSGCDMDGELTVEIPGLSGVRIEIYKTDGTRVTYRNNQSDQSVFDLGNGIYNVVLKKGAKTKVVEDVVVFGPTTLDDLVATLTVDLESMRGVRVEIRTDDGNVGSVGGMVFYHNNQSGEETYKVLKNSYDLVLKKGAKTKTVDAVDCYQDTCTAGDIVAPLSVNYEGLSGVRIEVHTDDGDDDNSAGGMVFYHNNQSGQKSYDVLKNTYDLVFKKGAKTKHVDVNCTGDTCTAGDIVAQLSVNYENLSGVRIEVHTDNDEVGTAGGMVFYHNNQSGEKSYDVLKNSYDLVFKKGAKTKVIDAVDCTTDETCSPGDIIATLIVNYEGLSGVRIEVHTDDGVDNSAGGMVFYHNNQSGNDRKYDVLKNTYDLVFKKGAKTLIVDAVDCTDNTCSPGDIIAALAVDYENLSGVRIEVRTDDGQDGSAGNLVFYHNNQSSEKSYDVLRNTYDLVFKKGAKTKIVNAVNCTGDTCSSGDIIATLTVDYGNLTGTRIEIRTNDGSSGSAGDMVLYHNNQSGVKDYDVLRNFYDIVLKKGSNTAIADAVNCTGNTCTLEESNLTIIAPNGTAVEMRTADGSTVVASVSNVGSDKKHVFSELVIGLYDIVLTQGAVSKTLDDVLVFGNPTVDELCQLTLWAPNGTAGEVKHGANVLSSVNNVGSDKKQVFDVIKGTWDVHVKQGAGEATTSDVDCTGETASVDQLGQLTVTAPNGTLAAVKDADGTLTSVSNVGSDKKHVFDVIKGAWDLYLEQGAGSKIIPVDCTDESQNVDELCQLTVWAPNGTYAEIQSSGGSVTSISNVGSDNKHVFDVIKGTWDLYLKQGDGEKTVKNVDCTGETQTVDQLVQWTVFAPNGTAVQVLTEDGSGVVTSIGNVGSDKKHVFDVVPNTYDLFLNQGAATKTVDNATVNASVTTDELCQLTVSAPNGTQVEVRTQGGGAANIVTSINNVGSDKKHVFNVVKGTYDLYLKQGASEKTVSNVVCTGETGAEDQLVQWTVFAPNGTELKVYTPDRSGVVTNIGNVGSDNKHGFDVVPNTYDLYLKQSAQVTWLDDVDVSSGKTSDQLCQLTVNAPNGTSVSVYVVNTTDIVASIGNVGSDNKHVFNVVKNIYDVYATVSPPKTEEDVDCTGETQSVTFPAGGLVLWNKLGSQAEIESSQVGLDGTFLGGSFVAGQFGNAFSADHTQDLFVRFPKEVVPTSEGTIEFWAKLTGFPTSIGGGHHPGFFEIYDGYSRFQMFFDSNNGAGHGGLCGSVGRGIQCGTGGYGYWEYKTVLGAGQVEAWHHYALVWDKNGIPGVADGTKKIAIFLDGQLNCTRWKDYHGAESKLVPLTGGELGLIYNWASYGTVAVDNIKIWNYAKTDFSDRFVE